MRLTRSLFLLLALAGCERRETIQVVIEETPSVESLVETILDEGGSYSDVPFADLIETATGKSVLSLDPNEPVDAEIIEGINGALARVLKRFNRSDSPTRAESRINEVSAHFEEALLEEVERDPALSCERPRTAEGNLQRTGYPDLLVRHLASGRIAYLDPKLVQEDALDSSLRTFYFTPRKETNKVLHDAHHLLVGIEHDGNTGKWKFLRWHLVDLTRFEVTLKAEFQASNRDLYQPGLVLETVEAP